MTILAASVLQAPSIAYSSLSPILIILGAACIGVLVEAFVPAAARFPSQVGLSIVAIASSFIAVFAVRSHNGLTMAGAISIDSPALVSMGAILIFGLLATMLFADRSLDSAGSVFVAEAAMPVGSRSDRALLTSERVQTEVFPLSLFSVGGMMVFVAANNLLVMFIALEVLSLPLYLMAGLSRRKRLLSQEAALKYFLLGAFASGFFVYGLALIYGFAGSIELRAISTASRTITDHDSLLILGMALLLVGLLFKAGVAPFHSWSPDVYQGSPSPVAGFMAAATKFAAFIAILRLMYVAFSGVPGVWTPVISWIAIISMVVGALIGLAQTDLKRLLAYSSIAHAGFILVGVTANSVAGTAATLFYTFTYGLSAIGAFALLSIVRRQDGEATSMDDWKGMGKRSPMIAAAMTVMMLSMTGVPLTAGFIGKLQSFTAASGSGHVWLIVVALVLSAITAVYYLRVIVFMYFYDAQSDPATIVLPGTPTTSVIALTTFATVLFGVIPGPLLHLVEVASRFVA